MTPAQPPAAPAPGEPAAVGPRVADLTEEELLARVFPLLPDGPATLLGPGDDAAVVAAPDGRFVVSTDVLVEDRHFRSRWSSGHDVGRRAAAQNLADVAAMGARPTALVVSLVVPGDTPAAWVTDLAAGLADACAPVGAAVVGGDLSGGDALVVAVTVHGDLEGRAPVLRSGARAGDVVAHAGVRGRSAAGWALLEAGLAGPAIGTAVATTADAAPHAGLVRAYLAPEPPLAAGPAAAAAGATAMLDVSDGLLRDAGRLARASGVVLDLDRAALVDERAVLREAATAVVRAGDRAPHRGATDEQDAVERLLDAWVLAGGEDHGLLATFPAGTAVPAPFRAVGRVLPADDAGPRVTVDGAAPSVATGWDHFHA